MKKIYVAPVQELAELDLTAMIAVSPEPGFSSLNESEGVTEEGYEGGYAKQDKSLWNEGW